MHISEIKSDKSIYSDCGRAQHDYHQNFCKNYFHTEMDKEMNDRYRVSVYTSINKNKFVSVDYQVYRRRYEQNLKDFNELYYMCTTCENGKWCVNIPNNYDYYERNYISKYDNSNNLVNIYPEYIDDRSKINFGLEKQEVMDGTSLLILFLVFHSMIW